MITFRNFRAAPQVRLVHEQVGTAAVGRDEAVPSFGVEPLADALPSMCWGRVHLDDVHSLFSTFIISCAELDGVALRDLRASSQIHLVDEDIRAASIGLDEAVLLLRREPLADASSPRGRALGLRRRRPGRHWSWQRRRRLHRRRGRDRCRRRGRRRWLRRLLARDLGDFDSFGSSFEVHHRILDRVAFPNGLLEVRAVDKYVSPISRGNEAVLFFVDEPPTHTALAAARRRRHRRRLRRGFGLSGLLLRLGGGGGGLLLLLARALVRHASGFGPVGLRGTLLGFTVPRGPYRVFPAPPC